jgi:hypothetical protein
VVLAFHYETEINVTFRLPWRFSFKVNLEPLDFVLPVGALIFGTRLTVPAHVPKCGDGKVLQRKAGLQEALTPFANGHC